MSGTWSGKSWFQQPVCPTPTTHPHDQLPQSTCYVSLGTTLQSVPRSPGLLWTTGVAQICILSLFANQIDGVIAHPPSPSYSLHCATGSLPPVSAGARIAPSTPTSSTSIIASASRHPQRYRLSPAVTAHHVSSTTLAQQGGTSTASLEPPTKRFVDLFHAIPCATSPERTGVPLVRRHRAQKS